MRYDVLRSVVNRHSCSIGETRYAFTLNWVAVQQSPENRDARLLLRVEAIPTSGPSRKRVLLHLLTGLAPVEDLRAMLDEALLQHFAEEQHAGRAGLTDAIEHHASH